MRKMILLSCCMLFLYGFSLFSASEINAQEFYPTYVAPGYTASEFLTLSFPTSAIEFDADRNLYTSDGSEFAYGIHDMNILVLYAASNYATQEVYTTYTTDAFGLNGLAFDSSENLFASEFAYPPDPNHPGIGTDWGYIRIIDESGPVGDPVFFPNYRPTGIAAIGNQIVYYPARKWSNPNYGDIHRLDFSSCDGTCDDTIFRPRLVATGIAINDSGQLFVGLRDNSIWTRDPYTNALLKIATFNQYIEELNFDWEGNLYALEAKQGLDDSTIIKLIPPVWIAIDIKPGSDPNCIKESSKGRIAVAILGGSDLDVNNIDVDTIIINDETSSVSPKRSSYKDVDGDGFTDLVCHFSTPELNDVGLLGDDKTLSITGEFITDGQMFLGSDVIFLAGEPNCLD